jgi:hypothetical protein
MSRTAWLAVSACVCLLAHGAAAIDLSGTWAQEKPGTCKYLNADGTRATERELFFEGPVAIAQTGAIVQLAADGTNYTGFVLASTKDVGEGTIASCPDPTFNVALRISSAKVKGDGGSMKVSLQSGGEAFVRTCTIKLSRTATVASAAPGCAPPP